MELLERNDGKRLQIICKGLNGVNVRLLQRVANLKIDEWMSIEVKKEDDEALYTCPNFITLAKRLEKPISKFDFYMIIGQIANSEKILRQLELDVNDILWNVDSIYISPMTRELKFIYLPYDQKARNKTKDLLNDIIYTSTQSKLEDTYLTEFVYYLKKPDAYNYKKLIDYIAKKEKSVSALLHLDDSISYEMPNEVDSEIISIEKVVKKQAAQKKSKTNWEIPMFLSTQNKASASEEKEVEIVYGPDDKVGIIDVNESDEPELEILEGIQQELVEEEPVVEVVEESVKEPVVEIVEEPTVEPVEEPVTEPEEATVEPVEEKIDDKIIEEPQKEPTVEESLDDLIEEVIIEKKKESKKNHWDFDILDFHFGKDRTLEDELQATVDFKLKDTEPKLEPEKTESVEEKEPEKEEPVEEPVQQPSLKAELTRVSTGEKITIDQDIFVIGKSKNVNGYTIEGNPAVSRRHASIQRKENAFFIIDLDSVNHVFINENEIPANKEYPISNGDVIVLGDEVFNFEVK